MPNYSLTNAKRVKNDEFYTQYNDIEREIEAYLEYDPNTFKNKVIYSNCDDPFESNFFRYFVLKFKTLGGNQWMGTSNYSATAVLVYDTDVVEVSNNNIRGNSDIGLYIYANGGTYVNNRVFDEGDDHDSSNYDYDYGLGNWGLGNVVTNNKVKGFEVAYEGVEGGKNITIPAGQGGQNQYPAFSVAE